MEHGPAEAAVPAASPANDGSDLRRAAAQTLASREDAETRIFALEQKLDRWVNYQTGLGTIADKTRAGYFETPWRLNDVEITDLVSGNDLAAKAVEKRPNEMFRRGYELESKKAGELDKSKIQDLSEYATERLQCDLRLHQGLTFGRQYGGALLILGIDDGREPWEPLDEKNIKSFDFINQIDRRFAYVQDYYSDPMQPKYGQPRTYLIANAVATSSYRSSDGTKFGYKTKSKAKLANIATSILNVHESRLIRFDGVEPDIITRQTLAGWSWSVLQRGYEVLRQCDGSFDALAYLISDASQGIFKLKGLFNAITAGQEGKLRARLELMERTRSVMHGVALDAGGEEDFTRVVTPMTGIPDAIDRIMQRLAAAFDMPLTELFGMSPAGMNATGESDRIKWYDTIANEQVNFLAPKIRRLYRLIALAHDSPFKGQPVDFKVHFHPLYAPTDDELAKTRFTNAQRDQIYIQNEVVTAEQVALTLSDIYQSIDVEEIEEEIEEKTKFDPYENDPSASAQVQALGGGAGGGTPEGQSPTVPLPGSALHSVVAPAGEGQGTPPDKGAGNPAEDESQPDQAPGAGDEKKKEPIPPEVKAKPAVGPAVAPKKPGPLTPPQKATNLAKLHLRAANAHLGVGNTAEAAKHIGKAEALTPKPPQEPIQKDALDAHDPDQSRDPGSKQWIDHGTKAANEASELAYKLGTLPAHREAAAAHMEASVAHIREGNRRAAMASGHRVSVDDRARHSDASARHFQIANDHMAKAGAHAMHNPFATNDAADDREGQASIVVVKNEQGKYLTVTRPEFPHEFAFPGGMIDEGETAQHAAIRELREETGVTATKLRKLPSVLSPVDGRKVNVFEALEFVGEAFAAEPNTTVMWLSSGELLSGAHTFRKTVQAILPETRADDFVEEDHPRDETGKFSAGGSGGTASRVKPERSGAHEHAAQSRLTRIHLTKLKESLKHVGSVLRSGAKEIGKAALHEVKEKIGEYKNAIVGVKNFVTRQPVTKEQKHAIAKVAIGIAASVVAGHVVGLLPLEAIGHEAVRLVSEKIAHQIAHHALEKMTEKGLSFAGYNLGEDLGGAIHDAIDALRYDSDADADPEEWLAQLVTEAAADYLDSLDEDKLQALIDSAGGESEGSTPKADYSDDQPRAANGQFGEGGGSTEPRTVSEHPDTSKLKVLGEGASRKVYEDGNTVIKVAKNAKAKKDNRAEAEASSKSDILAKITEHAPDYSWVRQEKVEPVTSAQLADHFGISKADQKKSYTVTIKDPWGGDQDVHGKDWLFAATYQAIHGGKSGDKMKSAGQFLTAMKELSSKLPKLDLSDFAYSNQWGRGQSGKFLISDYGGVPKRDSTRSDFDADQPRDERGRFGSGGSSASPAESIHGEPLFKESELASVPKEFAQPERTKEALFKAAPAIHEEQLDLLDRGKGVAQAIGAKVVRGDLNMSEQEFNDKLDLSHPGPVVGIGPIKHEARAEQKVNADYNGDWSKLGDVVRATVAVDSVKDVRGVIEAMKQKGITLARMPKDRMSNPTALGYRDVMMNVKYPSGHIGELQVHLKPLLAAKNGPGHRMYETIRNIQAAAKGRDLTPDERATVDRETAKSKALYDGVWSKVRQDAGDWDEGKHPRDEQGRFGAGGSASPATSFTPKTASPHEFKAAFDKAFEGSKFTNHVSHYSEDDLAHMKLFTTPDGKAGVAVHDHGDGRVEATALFNQGGEKGAGLKLLDHVVRNAGVNYVECYGPRLNKLYESVGFKPTSENSFNPEYAANGWDYKEFDHPSYYTMSYTPPKG
jgi:phage-related protein (TIGR01555 family)